METIDRSYNWNEYNDFNILSILEPFSLIDRIIVGDYYKKYT